MESIIALLPGQSDLTRCMQRLDKACLAEHNVRILSHKSEIQKLLGCDPGCTVTRYAGWGAAGGILVYAPFGLLAGLCQCNLLHFEQAFGMGAFLGGILAGAFVGGVLGAVVGSAESEKDTQLYAQGACMGDRIIIVEAQGEDVDRVKQILQQDKAQGIRKL